MRPVEPGEPFEVEYGNARTITLYAVSARQERASAIEEAGMKESDDPEAVFQYLKNCLRRYLPESEMSDSDFDTFADDKMNAAMIWEVLIKANRHTHIDEDDTKKSELPL